MIIFTREALMNNKMMRKSVTSERNYTPERQRGKAE
jgi:hypothetical protein